MNKNFVKKPIMEIDQCYHIYAKHYAKVTIAQILWYRVCAITAIINTVAMATPQAAFICTDLRMLKVNAIIAIWVYCWYASFISIGL